MKKFIKFIPVLFLSCLNLTSCNNITLTAHHIIIDTKTKEKTITYSFKLNIPTNNTLSTSALENLHQILIDKTPKDYCEDIRKNKDEAIDEIVCEGPFYDIDFTKPVLPNDILTTDVEIFYSINLTTFWKEPSPI